MTFQLSECEIHPATGPRLRQVCRFLIDQFPPDRPILERVIATGRGYATWTPYALYHGEELLGSLALMPLRIWLEGQRRDMVGIASVATVPAYRRMGVAGRLLDHCLAKADQQLLPSVLFTSLPRVYENAGFQAIRQDYLGTSPANLPRGGAGLGVQRLETINDDDCNTLATIYDSPGSVFSGKVERDAQYWRFCQLLFNTNSNLRILLCSDGGRPCGYVRAETEEGRLLISEVCLEQASAAVIEAVCTHIAEEARLQSAPWVTLSLPSDHAVRGFLERCGIRCTREPAGICRETLMVRPPRGRSLDTLSRLRWPLSDKF